MPDDVSDVDRQFLARRQFPLLRLFDVAGLALSPGSIALATMAALLVGLSSWFVDHAFPVDVPDSSIFSDWDIEPIPYPADVIGATMSRLVQPWMSVVRPLIDFFSSTQGWTLRINRAVQFMIVLSLWSFLGLVLCRRSAFLFVEIDESTLLGAIRFSAKRWLAALGAPLIPLAAAGLLGLVCAAIGVVGRLPFVGSWGLLIASPALLMLGFVIAFLLLVTVLGWPLMVAAVSVDDCDSFGGLSRAYSGLTGRPWHVLAYGLLTTVMGVILISIARLFAETTVWCALSSTAFGSGTESARESLAPPLAWFVRELVAGIGISFFWSASLVVYQLLRKEIDGVPFDRIAADDDQRPVHDPLPVVGIPATDARFEVNGTVSIGSQ